MGRGQNACAACPDEPDRLTTTISHHHLHACSLASTGSVCCACAPAAQAFCPLPLSLHVCAYCWRTPRGVGVPRQACCRFCAPRSPCLSAPAVRFVLPVLPACLRLRREFCVLSSSFSLSVCGDCAWALRYVRCVTVSAHRTPPFSPQTTRVPLSHCL